ncbi:MAG: hypothetical protein PF961_13195 [Planctomycetota bacterium]|jgi:hypothetical protein|nr:hypothetical protein [Planctomycetota bacterium]
MADKTVVLPIDDGGHLPPLPWLLRFLELHARTGTQRLQCARWPGANPILPELLSLAGIEGLVAPSPQRGWPRNWRWTAPSGARTQVFASAKGKGGGPDHAGLVPSKAEGQRSKALANLQRQCHLARYEDAAAVLSGGTGVAWNLLIASIDDPASPPPVVAGRQSHNEAVIHAWNPLALQRRCTVSVPATPGLAPWGLRDASGRSYPIQLAEGPLGRQFLSVVDLGPLECRRLEPIDDPVPGAHWEVSKKVLDNGRVRAEIDASGLIARLCIDGRFLPLSAPMPRPQIDGHTLIPTDSTISVLEDGPVRGRILVTMEHPAGVLSLTYSLYAEEELLRVGVSWRSEHGLELEHATAWRSGSAQVWWDGAGADVEQAASALHPTGRHLLDIRCLSIGAGGAQDAGLGIIGLRSPLDTTVQSGRVRVHCTDGTNYAIAAGDRRPDQWSLPLLALAAGEPGRGAFNAEASAAPFSLHGAENLVPVWIRRRGDGRTELTLIESTGKRGIAALAIPGLEKAPAVIDLAGRPLAELTRSGVTEPWELRYHAHQMFIVAW